MTDRRTRFREYIRALDPTGDPEKAVERGFYVPPPSAVSRQIANRLELEPASSHLLVGGIGSGKTTELIAVERILGEVEDIHVVRLDVLAEQRADRLVPGVLVGLAAREAMKRVSPENLDEDQRRRFSSHSERVKKVATGYWEDYWTVRAEEEAEYHRQQDEPPDIWKPGILQSPDSTYHVRSLVSHLEGLSNLLGGHLVLLFDGLDRILDIELFTRLVWEDLPALRQAGVGAVVVGPQHLRFSTHRDVQERFTAFHLHGAADPDDEAKRKFLHEVLARRVDSLLLPEPSRTDLIRWSGGLLRDLVSLARTAGEEAYADGSEVIGIDHVQTAADRLGRSLLLGLGQGMTDRLLAWARPRQAGSDVLSGDEDVQLLLHRLLIEIPGVPVRYCLHPTIQPLLSGLRRSA